MRHSPLRTLGFVPVIALVLGGLGALPAAADDAWPAVITIDSPADGARVEPGQSLTVKGTFVDGDAPVADALVTVVDVDGRVLCQTLTQADGIWECVIVSESVPAADGDFTIGAWGSLVDGNEAWDWVTLKIGPVWSLITITITSPGNGDRIDPLKNLYVTGTVTTDDDLGQRDVPLANAPVQVSDADGNRLCETTSQEDGTWTCVVPEWYIPDESGEVVIQAESVAPTGNSAIDIVVVVVDYDVHLDITIERPAYGADVEANADLRVAGTVAEGDVPLANAPITIVDESGNALCATLSDAAGKWACAIPADKLPDAGADLVLRAVTADPSGNEWAAEVVVHVVGDTPGPVGFAEILQAIVALIVQFILQLLGVLVG
jgi:hypothetical protein